MRNSTPRNAMQSSSLNSNYAMSKVGNSLTSTLRQDIGTSFGVARNRFYEPAFRKQSPSPVSYQIPNTIGFNLQSLTAKHHNQSKNVMGKESRDKEFIKLITPLDNMPGPGSYAHYTRFNND